MEGVVENPFTKSLNDLLASRLANYEVTEIQGPGYFARAVMSIKEVNPYLEIRIGEGADCDENQEPYIDTVLSAYDNLIVICMGSNVWRKHKVSNFWVKRVENCTRSLLKSTTRRRVSSFACADTNMNVTTFLTRFTFYEEINEN